MLMDLAINLVASLIGFLGAQMYLRLKQGFSRRAIKWFWVPVPSTRIYLFYGEWMNLLSNVGELEPVINVQDALTLGELRMFLEPYYPEVVVTTNKNTIDWQFPVISLGGPLPNSLTKEIGEKGLLPIWFLDMPYSQDSERIIGSVGRAEVFRSEFNEDGMLVTDVGFVARLRSPENPLQFLYIIAGNYGMGNFGVVRHLTSTKKLVQLQSLSQDQYFQTVIRSYISGRNITNTELIHYKRLD